MKKSCLVIGLGLLVLGSPTAAYAYCGVIQEQATALTADRAVQKAEKLVNRKVKQLKRQNGDKLQLDERTSQCVGGALSIDGNGNQVEGKPSCTVAQPFCVNP